MKKRILEGCKQSAQSFLIFFLVCGFVVTCSFLLFFDGIELPRPLVEHAAKITFLNILALAMLFSIIDTLRRRETVDRPVQQIIAALEQITQGDFSTRLTPTGKYTGFEEIMQHINRMTEELSGVETLRTDFISSVSHEMRTPLAIIQNYCTLLQSPDLQPSEQREYTNAIALECRRLSNLMSNILKLNRLENQQIYQKTEAFDMSEQLRECLLQFEQVWESKQLNIDAEIPDNITLTGDRELLWIVWSNLLSNAFKFTDRGSVSLQLTATDTHATVTITDTGCGMSPEVGKHIFQKFYQGDSSHATEGNGLGLALVKRIIDIVGGEISVSSIPNSGTVFTVKLKR